MKKIIYVIFISVFLLTSCKEKPLELMKGPLTFEKRKGTIVMLDDGKLAYGFVKGKDPMIDMEYESFYKKGFPTGKTNYYFDGKLMISVDMNFNVEKDIATGNIEIYEYNENDVSLSVMSYKNIESNINFFFDLKKGVPVLQWFFGDETNIYKSLDLYKLGENFFSIKDGEYIFYDERNQPIYIDIKSSRAHNEDNSIVEDKTKNIESLDKISSKTDEKNNDIIFQTTDKSVTIFEKKSEIKSETEIEKTEKTKKDNKDEKDNKDNKDKKDKKDKKNKKDKKDENLEQNENERLNGIGITYDKFNNKYELNYENGIPKGGFTVSSAERDVYEIIGNGLYDFDTDVWNGDITLFLDTGDRIEITGASIKGPNLFTDKNQINYSWISFEPTSYDPLDLSNIYLIDDGEVYLNGSHVGDIVEGQWQIPAE